MQTQQQPPNSFNTNGSGPISLQLVNQNIANVSLSNTASKSVSPTFVNVATHHHQQQQLHNHHNQHFKQSSDITLDEKLINSTLFNQSSRSRKPFNLTEYETNINNTNQKLNTNTNTSFDDLDAIEVLNLNNNNNNRSIHSKPFQNPYFYSNQNPQQVISSMYHSQENLSQQQQQQQQQIKKHPVSILKRFDSSEKMYPISRPASTNNNGGSQTTLFANQNDFSNNNINNHHHNSYLSQQMNTGTFPRQSKQRPHSQQHQHQVYSNEANIYDQHQKVTRVCNTNGNTINTPNLQQIRQKRVQFANIPPSPANTQITNTGKINIFV